MLLLIICLVSRLQTFWTVMPLLLTRNLRERSSLWTHKASSSWCRSELRTLLCIPPSIRISSFLAHCFVITRYRSGIRGHMKAVVMDLLRQYLKVEIQFQNGEEQSSFLNICCARIVFILCCVALTLSLHLMKYFHINCSMRFLPKLLYVAL